MSSELGLVSFLVSVTTAVIIPAIAGIFKLILKGIPINFRKSHHVKNTNSNRLPSPIALRNFLIILTQSNNIFLCQLSLKSSSAKSISEISSSIEAVVDFISPRILLILKPKSSSPSILSLIKSKNLPCSSNNLFSKSFFS